MHNDQRRIKSKLLPHLMDKVMSDDPVAVRDCTVINRTLIQGADPLLLTELCPDDFRSLCRDLGLSEESGRDAIEQAHVRGPGILLDLVHGGLPSKDYIGNPTSPESWRREALWLVLAGLSDTTEEGYTPDTTILERLQRVVAVTTAFHCLTMESGSSTAWGEALYALRKFEASCNWTIDPTTGVPHCTEDHGFYIGYRLGHKCVAVTHGDKTFFGCIPGVTLDNLGIEVDEKVSESYGFRRVQVPSTTA